jgi:hypothetical protein
MVCLAAAGCGAPTVSTDPERMTPMVLTTHAQAGVRDLRGLFRQTLCGQPEVATPQACENLLRRIGTEPEAPALSPAGGLSGTTMSPSGASGASTALTASTASTAPTAPTSSAPPAAAAYRIAIVPGLLAECLPPTARPFADAVATLRGQGWTAIELLPGGRTTVAVNAERLARQIEDLPADDRPLVVFAYSKGLPDVLEVAVRHPRAGQHIAAIVSIAGSVNGSALAERYDTLYRTTLMRLPLPGCEQGDGDELDDLRREARVTWWQANRSRIGVPLYSIVALPRPDQVSPALALEHAALSRIDPMNDGQMLWTDAVAAPGALLGYVNADHWAIAMQLSDTLPLLAPMFRDDVPRAAVLRSAVQVVAQDLRAKR